MAFVHLDLCLVDHLAQDPRDIARRVVDLCMWLEPQDTAMMDSDKCIRCYKKASSWFGVPWDDVCEMSKAPEHQKSFEEAEASLKALEKGEDVKFCTPMTVATRKKTGYRMEAAYSFPTQSQFKARFKHDPKNLGCKIQTLTAEDGLTELKGVILKFTPSMPTWRRVTFYSDTLWMVDEQLVRASDRLSKRP
jgi:hypothetical protein